MRSILAVRLLLATLMSGVAAAAPVDPASGPVVLVPPFAVAASDEASGAMIKFSYDDLAKVDPTQTDLVARYTQTLSLFGREDLIVATSEDYKPRRCTALPGAGDVFDAVVRGARATRIVIVNESHERSEYRGFTADIAARLRAIGYDTLAMEALVHDGADVPARYRAPFVRQPELPYLSDDDGHYVAEAGFGRLGRRAKALGYRLLAYELNDYTGDEKLTRAQQIAKREEAQAHTIAAYVAAHPRAKLLVHVGYSHAGEVTTATGDRWLAARLKAKTGIDPLTISQTTCHGSGDTTRLAVLPADQPRGLFDLVVDHPAAQFVRGRPVWRLRAGDRAVTIPATLYPRAGWRVIEARPVGEPADSVPLDRVAIRAGENIALMLPPGRYALRAVDVAAKASASVAANAAATGHQ